MEIEDDLDIDDGSLEELINSNLNESYEEQHNLIRSADSLSIIFENYINLANKAEVSIEDLNNFKSLIDISLAGTDISCEEVFPALEFFEEPKLALEGMGERIKNFFKREIEEYNKRVIKDGDSIKLVYTFFNREKKKLNNLHYNLHSTNLDEKNVRLKVTSSFIYGDDENSVKDEKEYIQKVQESFPAIIAFSEEINKFTRESLGILIKTAFSALTSPNETFVDNYYKIKDFIKSIVSKQKMNKVSNEKGVVSYQTDVLLGNYSISCDFPEEEISNNSGKEIKHKKIYKKFNVDFYRRNKIYPGRYVFLNLNKNDVTVLLEEAKKLNEEYSKILRFPTKLSMNYSNQLDAFSLAPPMIVFYIFANHRMVLKLNSLINDNIGSSFYVAKSHTKTIISLAEKYMS